MDGSVGERLIGSISSSSEEASVSRQYGSEWGVIDLCEEGEQERGVLWVDFGGNFLGVIGVEERDCGFCKFDWVEVDGKVLVDDWFWDEVVEEVHCVEWEVLVSGGREVELMWDVGSWGWVWVNLKGLRVGSKLFTIFGGNVGDVAAEA